MVKDLIKQGVFNCEPPGTEWGEGVLKEKL